MRVQINYDILNNNGGEYINYSSILQTIVNDLNIRSENISKIWNSSNGKIYTDELNKCINFMQVDANRMKRYGNTILNIKDDFKEKDLSYGKQIFADSIKEDIDE